MKATDDFEVTGDGDAKAWEKAEWEPLHARGEKGLPYETRVKVLYSKKGLYVLMDATDKKLTATFEKDFENLWTEDVFEVFLWPDERDPLYFEYEISPLGRELPILVPNTGRQVPGLAALALRGRPQDPQGDLGHRRRAEVRARR